MVDQCNNGVFGTMQQAVEELAVPRIKPVRPFKAFDGPLTLGDPTKYPSAVSIHVERYFKTKRAVAPPASTVVVNTDRGGLSQTETLDEDTEMGGNEFSGVKHMRTYRVNDNDAPGGKRDIEFEDLAKGYQYGRTVVPFSESDFSVTKLETTKSFTIIGFVPFSSVSRPSPSPHWTWTLTRTKNSTTNSSTWAKPASSSPRNTTRRPSSGSRPSSTRSTSSSRTP